MEETQAVEKKTVLDYLKDDLLYFFIYIIVSLITRWTFRLIFGFEYE